MDEKEWLFKENIRLEALSNELEQQKRILKLEQERLEGEKKVFEQQRKVLELGFQNLAADKEMFRSEIKREKKKQSQKKYDKEEHEIRMVTGPGFFGGVMNESGLKRRYKELMKIYHPDNKNGDSFTSSCITREYEIKKEQIKKDRI